MGEKGRQINDFGDEDPVRGCEKGRPGLNQSRRSGDYGDILPLYPYFAFSLQ